MANPTTGYGFKPYKSRHGGAFELNKVTVGATALKAGDVFKIVGGLAVIMTEGAVPMGVMAENTAATEVGLYYPLDSIIFKARTEGAAYLNTDHDGNAYDIVVTTGVGTVDLSDTDDEIFRVLEMAPTGTEAGTGAEVLGVFIVNARGAGVAALA